MGVKDCEEGEGDRGWTAAVTLMVVWQEVHRVMMTAEKSVPRATEQRAS